jgi:hypothetical protein
MNTNDERVFFDQPTQAIAKMTPEQLAQISSGLVSATPPTKDTNPKSAIGDAKVPLWLLSSIAKIHWAMAQFAGLVKYGAWNWRAAGVRASTYLSAIERHLEAYKNGEEYDPVDGTHHLGNIMACCAILLDARESKMLTDDRPPTIRHRDAIQEAEQLMAKLKVQYADKNPRHYTITDTRESA